MTGKGFAVSQVVASKVQATVKAPAPVCLAGMHGSGLSLVSSVLKICGLDLAASDKGEELESLTEQVLDELGAGWDFPPVSSAAFSEDDRFFPLQTKARLLLQAQSTGRWGWRDACASLTLPFWKNLLPGLKTIICLRNPLEVALALRQRHCSFPLAFSLWTAYNELLLQTSPPADRLITHFDAYFHQPEIEIRKLLTFLDLTVSEGLIRQSTQVVNSQQRHHRFTTTQLLDARLSGRIVDLYMRLCAEAGWTDDAVGRAKSVLPSEATLSDRNGRNGPISAPLKQEAPQLPRVAAGRFDKAVVEVELLRREIDLLRHGPAPLATSGFVGEHGPARKQTRPS